MKTKLTAVLLLALMACSKNDSAPKFDLAGNWIISSPTMSGNLIFKRINNDLYSAPDPTQNFTILGDVYDVAISRGYIDYYSPVQVEYGGYGNTTMVNFQVSFQANNPCLSGDYDTLRPFIISYGQVSNDFKTITFTTKYALRRYGCDLYSKTITETLIMTRVP